MNTPIALICGSAGSGKDTLAAMLAEILNGTCIAQADPMKRLAAKVFGFSEDQLWGPSESRNSVDGRYVAQIIGEAGGESEAKVQVAISSWKTAARNLLCYGRVWIQDVLLTGFSDSAFEALWEWFCDVAKAHGFLVTLSRAKGWTDRPIDRFEDVAYIGGADRFTPPTRQLTPRYVLQTLGTEWGRKQSPAMWSEYAIRTARALLAGGCTYDRAKGLTTWGEGLVSNTNFVIITDGRFRNEIVNVKAIGGTTIEVVAPYKADTIGNAGVAGHRSEAELKGTPNHFFDHVIVNDKAHGLEALKRLAHNLTSMTTKPTLFATAWPEDIARTR